MSACRVCGVRPRVVTVTDLHGRATYHDVPCLHERRYAERKCVDCEAPRAGTRLRCEKHRLAKRRADRAAASRRYDKTPKGKARKKAFQGTPEYLAAAAERKREKYHALPREQKRTLLDSIRRRYQMFSGPGYTKRKQWERTTRERKRERQAA